MILAFHVYIHRHSSTSDIDILIKHVISPGYLPLILLSNLGTRFVLRGVDYNTQVFIKDKYLI
jgi:predicted nucleotidyltransferase